MSGKINLRYLWINAHTITGCYRMHNRLTVKTDPKHAILPEEGKIDGPGQLYYI